MESNNILNRLEQALGVNNDVGLLREAFNGEDQIVHKLAEEYMNARVLPPVVGDIARYVLYLKRQIGDLKRKHESSSVVDGPAAKRLKQDPDSAISSHAGPVAQVSGKPILTATEISFAVPVRKKLALSVLGGANPGIQVTNATGGVELQIPLSSIEQVICVPVPEKAQPAKYFVVVPRSGQPQEPMVWTVPTTEAKNVTVFGREAVQPGESYEAVMRRTLDETLSSQGKKVVTPNAKEFVSSLVQAHRKDEKAFHVKAFKGSKEGYLYFLPLGILFGFRKPIMYFPFAGITSVSYSSVLQRTFNLNIQTDDEEIEFAMLDQSDFEGIDRYVKAHGLHDASLAESRKAKVYNVNKQANGQAANANGDQKASSGGDGDEDESAIERAERELQDAEDAEEEDFDPGSDGDSDGSGSGSEDEDEETAEGGDENGEEYEEEEEEEDQDVEDEEAEEEDVEPRQVQAVDPQRQVPRRPQSPQIPQDSIDDLI